jgi:hypothetical protein
MALSGPILPRTKRGVISPTSRQYWREDLGDGKLAVFKVGGVMGTGFIVWPA